MRYVPHSPSRVPDRIVTRCGGLGQPPPILNGRFAVLDDQEYNVRAYARGVLWLHFTPTPIGPLHDSTPPAHMDTFRAACEEPARVEMPVGLRPSRALRFRKWVRVSFSPNIWGPYGGKSLWVYVAHCANCGQVHWALGELFE